MSKYKTIIFDLDGTLLDTLEDLTDSVNYALQQHQMPERTIGEIKSFVGNGIYRLIERAVPEKTSKEIIDEVFEVFKAYYETHCLIKTKLYQGILELLQELKLQGYKMGIVSNKNDEAVQELYEIFFKEHISFAVGPKENMARKPKPDMVYEAIRYLHTDKEECLYIGDSEVDYETANNAGLDLILVSWGFREKEQLEQLDKIAIIDEPNQLLKYLS